MGERSYNVGGGVSFRFSDDDDTFGCLCTFPHNDAGALDPDRVAALALLGAAVVLAKYDPDLLVSGAGFLPYAVPQWIRDGILKVTDGTEERERCAAIVQSHMRFYPENIFHEPPLGEHGKTVDACSAAAIRSILPVLAEDIRNGGAE